MTLGCGAIAGNITSDNIGPMHLINIKRIAYHVRDAAAAFESPEGKAYFAGSARRGDAETARPRGGGTPGGRDAEMRRRGGAGTGGSRPGSAEAVEQYLVSRGLREGGGPGRRDESRRGTQESVRHGGTLANPAEAVVDRFLASRRPSYPAPVTVPVNPAPLLEAASPPPPAPAV